MRSSLARAMATQKTKLPGRGKGRSTVSAAEKRSSAKQAPKRAKSVPDPSQQERRSLEPEARRGQEHTFPVVGIGASAGGLEAIEQFLRNVPHHSGMAFVVVQHLDPNHKGMLVELLQR